MALDRFPTDMIEDRETGKKLSEMLVDTNTQLAEKASQINDVYNNKTVAEMKTNSKPKAGDIIRTFGFYSFGDGGGADYLVVANTGKVGNDITLFDLPNTLQATLIHNGKIKVEQIGCKRDTNYDNTPNIVKGIGANIKDFYFLAGNYQFNELLITWDTAYTETGVYNLGVNVRLHGASNVTMGMNAKTSTVFSPYQTGQKFIVKFGGKSDYSTPTGALETDVSNVGCIEIAFDDTGKPTSYGCLSLEFVYSSHFSLAFFNNDGRSMYLRNCWELDFDKLIVRENKTKNEAVYIDTPISDGASNTSRLFFKEIDVEGLSGTFLKTSLNPLASNIMIGTFSYEHNFTHAYTNVDLPKVLTDFKGYTKIPLFDLGYMDGLSIDQMNLCGMSKKYFTDGTTNYTDSLFRFNSFFNVSVSNININDAGGYVQIADGVGDLHSILRVNGVTSSKRNRLWWENSYSELLMLSTVTNGGVIIPNNSFKMKDTMPYAILGKMYTGEDLLKACAGIKSSHTLAYDSDAINGYVLKRTNTDFFNIIDMQITTHFIGRIRIKTDSVSLDILTKDANGNTSTLQGMSLVGSAASYVEYEFAVRRDPGVASFRLNVSSGTTICLVDYVYLRPLPSVMTASSPTLANNGSIQTYGFTLSRVNPSSAVTGIILQAGTYGGQEVVVINEATASNSITFSSSGSNVADGNSTIINGGTARKFIWDVGTSLWYRIQ